MSTTNEIWLAGERLDLDDETQLLPSFQANDRTKPDTIQSDYSPEFSVPGTAHNHRLLKHAAASQPAQGSAYVRMPCVLTSGGVETMPLALLYIKGYEAGRYSLQIFSGNKRFVEALGDKTLADLDLDRFNHYWTAAEVLAGLPYAHWAAKGWGYEVYERGKPLDLNNLDPFTVYPSVAAWLVWQQVLTDAGFTADSLLTQAFFAALSVPSANPYEYPQKFRDARQLTAGYFYQADSVERYFYHYDGGFEQERLNFSYTSRKPYHAPDVGTATYFAGRYTVDTLGYYDVTASIPTFFGCNSSGIGRVRIKYMLLVNGQHLFDPSGAELGKDEQEQKGYVTKTFTPKLSHYLLRPGDTVELVWRGDEIGGGLYNIGPDQPHWYIGPYGAQVPLDSSQVLAAEVKFTVTLLAEFPPGGLVKLQDWLPEMKQSQFVETVMAVLGLTIECDPYEPHLHLSTGQQVFKNLAAGKVLNWSNKRDAYAQPGRLPERDLAYRLDPYAQKNNIVWQPDENITNGYGDGVILIADEVLPATADLITLPFAATEPSAVAAPLLRILNFEPDDLTATPPTYSKVEAKPRLVLRADAPEIQGQLITTSATPTAPAVLTAFTTTASYFASPALSLLLDDVLATYWPDVLAMVDEARVLVENYRLTATDIAKLSFSTPIWDELLGDYFILNKVTEFDPRRPTAVQLVRLNAKHLPPPVVPGGMSEWYEGEFGGAGEWY